MSSPSDPHANSASHRQAVFFDRDGVVNRVILREGKPYSPSSLEEFVLTEGIRKIVFSLKEMGYVTLVITNQPDLARGRITSELLNAMMEKVREEIPFDDVMICPHDDHHQCSCRKPKPGMLFEASKKWSIDLQRSFFIGDTWKDMEAGRGAGCRTILLDAPYNREVACDFRALTPEDALQYILNAGT